MNPQPFISTANELPAAASQTVRPASATTTTRRQIIVLPRVAGDEGLLLGVRASYRVDATALILDVTDARAGQDAAGI